MEALELEHCGKWRLESFKNLVLAKNLHGHSDGSCEK
jgi:hypothetical protein